MRCRLSEPGRGVVARLLWVAVAASLVAGCTHRADPARELNAAVAPFTSARDQTIAQVTAAKHAVGASDMNTLAVAYAALETKANRYVDFLAESVSVTSFDASKNDEAAADLQKGFAAFNKSMSTIDVPKPVSTPISAAWIPGFAQSVQTYWQSHQADLEKASPETKADLVRQLKGHTVWPNYENIATQPVTAPH